MAPKAGLSLNESLSPAEKLAAIQKLAVHGTEAEKAAVRSIYETIGVYLGHSAALYHDIYRCRNILLLGRVMSGSGGEIILGEAERVLSKEYQDKESLPRIVLPDEKSRRVGQAVAAASLPEVRQDDR